MAKALYEDWLTEDGLLTVEGWARNGLTNKQISQNIGITYKTLKEWQNKFSAFRAALKKGRRPVEIEVENSLVKRANGFVQEEVVEEITIDADGNQTKHKRVTHKVFPPDTAAAIFYLKNRSSHRFKDRPKTPEELEAIKLDNKLKEYKIEEYEQLLSGDNPTVTKVKELLEELRRDAYAESTDE